MCLISRETHRAFSRLNVPPGIIQTTPVGWPYYVETTGSVGSIYFTHLNQLLFTSDVLNPKSLEDSHDIWRDHWRRTKA